MSLFGFHRLQSKYVNRHVASVPRKLHRHIILSQSPFHALFNSKLQCQGKCKCCSPEPNSWRSSQGRIGQVQPLSLINIWAMQASGLGRGLSSRPMNQGAASRPRGGSASSVLQIAIANIELPKQESWIKAKRRLQNCAFRSGEFCVVIVSIWVGQTGAIRT